MNGPALALQTTKYQQFKKMHPSVFIILLYFFLVEVTVVLSKSELKTSNSFFCHQNALKTECYNSPNLELPPPSDAPSLA